MAKKPIREYTVIREPHDRAIDATAAESLVEALELAGYPDGTLIHVTIVEARDPAEALILSRTYNPAILQTGFYTV